MTEDAPVADIAPEIGPADAAGLMDRPEELAFELRAQEGAIWTGGRLLIGIVTFAFASLAFAYFYLRSANNEHLWRPHAITAPTSIGAAIFTIAVASAALNVYGTLRMRRGLVVDWEVSGWTAVLGLLLAIAFQIWELTELPFYPGSSGYASCFVGWAVLNCGLLLGSAYWLETVLARSLRLRRAVAEDGGAARSALPVARLFRANLESCSAFLVFAALVELLFWMLFYVL
jgi:hypothetical protein